MHKAALIVHEFGQAEKVLQALDDAGKPKIDIALLVYLSEYEDWRLVLSSRQLDSKDTLQAYRAVFNVLRSAEIGPEQIPPLLLMRSADPYIRALRRIFSKAKSVTGVRFGGQLLADRFVEDAYVYRVS